MLEFEKLLEFADQHECARRVWVRDRELLKIAAEHLGERAAAFDGTVRVDDLKYHVSQSELRHLPMTELQAMRVNASIETGDWMRFLSPRQRELLERIRKHPDADWPKAIGVPIEVAWRAAAAVKIPELPKK
ncbi:MAG: hypothetical protein AB7I19_13090 [Planctomycetota bacterium]